MDDISNYLRAFPSSLFFIPECFLALYRPIAENKPSSFLNAFSRPVPSLFFSSASFAFLLSDFPVPEILRDGRNTFSRHFLLSDSPPPVTFADTISPQWSG